MLCERPPPKKNNHPFGGISTHFGVIFTRFGMIFDFLGVIFTQLEWFLWFHSFEK